MKICARHIFCVNWALKKADYVLLVPKIIASCSCCLFISLRDGLRCLCGACRQPHRWWLKGAPTAAGDRELWLNQVLFSQRRRCFLKYVSHPSSSSPGFTVLILVSRSFAAVGGTPTSAARGQQPCSSDDVQPRNTFVRIACNRATIVFPAGVVAAPTLRVYAG